MIAAISMFGNYRPPGSQCWADVTMLNVYMCVCWVVVCDYATCVCACWVVVSRAALVSLCQLLLFLLLQPTDMHHLDVPGVA